MRTVALYTPFQKTLMIALEIAHYKVRLLTHLSLIQSPVSRLLTCCGVAAVTQPDVVKQLNFTMLPTLGNP